MKRLLFLCAYALLMVGAYAQDIIVTKDAQKMEVKILEVSKTEIKYKEKDNLNGPTFILETKEINSIIYSNGKVVLYNQDAPAVPTIDEKTIEILLLSGNTITAQLVEMNSNYVSFIVNGKSEVIPASQIEKVTLLANGQVKEYNGRAVSTSNGAQTTGEPTTAKPSTPVANSGRIYRDNGHYLYNNAYIESAEVERILRRENAAAYKEWQKADRLLIGGGVCIGIGGGMALGGLFTLISHNYTACVGIECGALVPFGIGLGLTLGSTARYNKAINIYNSKFDHAAMQLKWHIAPTELGFAFVF